MQNSNQIQTSENSQVRGEGRGRGGSSGFRGRGGSRGGGNFRGVRREGDFKRGGANGETRENRGPRIEENLFLEIEWANLPSKFETSQTFFYQVNGFQLNKIKNIEVEDKDGEVGSKVSLLDNKAVIANWKVHKTLPISQSITIRNFVEDAGRQFLGLFCFPFFRQRTTTSIRDERRDERRGDRNTKRDFGGDNRSRSQSRDSQTEEKVEKVEKEEKHEENKIIEKACYSGENQEDSIVVSKVSLEKGTVDVKVEKVEKEKISPPTSFNWSEDVDAEENEKKQETVKKSSTSTKKSIKKTKKGGE